VSSREGSWGRSTSIALSKKVLKIFLHKMAARGLGVACLLLGLLAGCLAEEPAAEDKFAGVLAAEPEGKVPPPAPASRANKVERMRRAGRGG
jgi:hypothetical protein